MTTTTQRHLAETSEARSAKPEGESARFAPIGIQAVAAAAYACKVKKHNEVVRELPPLLRKDKWPS